MGINVSTEECRVNPPRPAILDAIHLRNRVVEAGERTFGGIEFTDAIRDKNCYCSISGIQGCSGDCSPDYHV